jgi:micrococcal nuclease
MGLRSLKNDNTFSAVTMAECCFVVLLAISLQVFPGLSWGKSPPSSGKVAFVCDGDTIILESGERIRYLGIDAPEVAHENTKADCFGDEAKKVNSDLVLYKQVSLQYDREVIDLHGRFLAYVILSDGRCANLEMLRAGCACIFRSSNDFRRLEEFLLLQQEAIHKLKGMWGSCPVKSAKTYIGNRGSFVFHRPECALGKKIGIGERANFTGRWPALEQGYRPCRYCKP